MTDDYRDPVCDHVDHGHCDLDGQPCIRWDDRGKLREDVRFSDCQKIMVENCKVD